MKTKIKTIYKKASIKQLHFGKIKFIGKGNSRVTVYHRGSGHKRIFRYIDLLYYIWNVYGIVVRFEKDANRTSLLYLVAYANGILSLRTAVENIRVGMRIRNGLFRKLYYGWSSYLFNIKTGLFISGLELYFGLGSQYCRASGSYAKVISKKIFQYVTVGLNDQRRLFLCHLC